MCICRIAASAAAMVSMTGMVAVYVGKWLLTALNDMHTVDYSQFFVFPVTCRRCPIPAGGFCAVNSLVMVTNQYHISKGKSMCRVQSL